MTGNNFQWLWDSSGTFRLTSAIYKFLRYTWQIKIEFKDFFFFFEMFATDQHLHEVYVVQTTSISLIKWNYMITNSVQLQQV